MAQSVKKQTLFLLFVLISNINLLARDYNSNFAPNYEIGQTKKHLITGGIGMGVLDYNEFAINKGKMIPPFSLSYEYKIGELFGVGAATGFSRIKYLEEDQRTNEPDYIYSWSYIPVDLRLNFHFVTLVNELAGANVPTDNIDLYASFFVGAEYRVFTAINKKMENAVDDLNDSESTSSSSTSSEADTDTDRNLDEDKDFYKNKISAPNLGFMLGIRYMSTEHFGFFLEGGKGPVSYFSVGVAAEF